MNSNLQNKLQQFSAKPPEGVWDKIADALDAEQLFPQRLYLYEEQPPAAAWEKIEKNLEEALPAKVVPFTTRFRKALRYAAVACILAVILVTITLTVKRTEAGAIEAESHTTVPTHNTTSTIQDKLAEQSNSTTKPDPLQGNNNTETASAGKKSIREKPEDNKIDPDGKTLPAKMTNANYASLNEYVLFSDGDGRVRKVSKKLASFVNCKDSDGACKQRLQQLRQKLAAKAMNTDFTGILEMMHQLQ